MKKENINILISNHKYLKSQCENFNLPFLEIKKDYEIEIQKAFNFFV